MLSRIDKYKVLKACSSRNGGKKAYKLGVYYKLGGGSNNGKWNSNIVMLERKLRTRRGSCQSSILRLTLVLIMSSHMTRTKNMGIGSIILWSVRESPNIPRRHDKGRLNILTVGSWLIVVSV